MTQAARIAMAAGLPFGICLVARNGYPVINPESRSLKDDFSLGKSDQWRVDGERSAIDARLGRQPRHRLESRDKFRSAIGIAGIIHGIDSDKNVVRAKRLSPSQRHRQHDGIAGGDVGDGNFVAFPVFGDGDAGVGERGTAELAEIGSCQTVLMRPQRGGDAARGGNFSGVALAIGYR